MTWCVRLALAHGAKIHGGKGPWGPTFHGMRVPWRVSLYGHVMERFGQAMTYVYLIKRGSQRWSARGVEAEGVTHRSALSGNDGRRLLPGT